MYIALVRYCLSFAFIRNFLNCDLKLEPWTTLFACTCQFARAYLLIGNLLPNNQIYWIMLLLVISIQMTVRLKHAQCEITVRVNTNDQSFGWCRYWQGGTWVCRSGVRDDGSVERVHLIRPLRFTRFQKHTNKIGLHVQNRGWWKYMNLQSMFDLHE